MITPEKLFPAHTALTVTKRDVRRLESHLSCTGKLNELLVLDTIGITDLRRMVCIEASSATPRYIIIRKLLGRIATRERQRVLNAISSSRA